MGKEVGLSTTLVRTLQRSIEFFGPLKLIFRNKKCHIRAVFKGLGLVSFSPPLASIGCSTPHKLPPPLFCPYPPLGKISVYSPALINVAHTRPLPSALQNLCPLHVMIVVCNSPRTLCCDPPGQEQDEVNEYEHKWGHRVVLVLLPVSESRVPAGKQGSQVSTSLLSVSDDSMCSVP